MLLGDETGHPSYVGECQNSLTALCFVVNVCTVHYGKQF